MNAAWPALSYTSSSSACEYAWGLQNETVARNSALGQLVVMAGERTDHCIGPPAKKQMTAAVSPGTPKGCKALCPKPAGHADDSKRPRQLC